MQCDSPPTIASFSADPVHWLSLTAGRGAAEHPYNNASGLLMMSDRIMELKSSLAAYLSMCDVDLLTQLRRQGVLVASGCTCRAWL